MANRVNTLEERLHGVDITTPVIVYSTMSRVEKPDPHFDDAFANFSGLHSLHSLKKEDRLNIHSGTAAIVLKSVHESVTYVQVFV